MDVTTETFDREVIEASRTQPVVVDFWAPWCGPCRALGPVLEKVATDFAGRIKLVKINSDDHQELSAAFGVRSIPNVIGFKHGQAVAQFMGAVPEAQVRSFFEKLLPSAAEALLARGEAALAAQRIEEAEQCLAEVPHAVELGERIAALEQAISYARAARDGPSEADLRATLTDDPNDHDTRLALATLYGSQHRYREAMTELLEIVQRARNWRDGAARTQLLALFTLASAEAELVTEYRRKLASALH